ncbi:MAG: mitochondrial import inner membrane translocase subunit TIM16 [Chaenotheca gracillima]|nr:MAG: mitochondrial import inner membrane translocase subunit TIM16 [Chaenotheca gracillima]
MDTPQYSDHYVLLGIERCATTAQIKRAYHRNSLLYHPDKNLDRKEWAERKFKDIQSAYDALKETYSRERYDRKLPLLPVNLDTLLAQLSDDRGFSCLGTTQHNVRCERPLSKRTRDELLLKVKELLDSKRSASELRSWINDLAHLSLCTLHRSAEMMEMFTSIWTEEVLQKGRVKPESKPAPGTQQLAKSYRKSDGSIDIQALFSLDLSGPDVLCASKFQCKTAVSSAEADLARDTIAHLEVLTTTVPTALFVKTLAALVHCDRHMDEVQGKSLLWHTMLLEALDKIKLAKTRESARRAPAPQPTTPTRAASSNPPPPREEPTTPPVTPQQAPSGRQRQAETPPATPSPQPSSARPQTEAPYTPPPATRRPQPSSARPQTEAPYTPPPATRRPQPSVVPPQTGVPFTPPPTPPRTTPYPATYQYTYYPVPQAIDVLAALSSRSYNLKENSYCCTGTTLKGERCRNPRWEPKNTEWQRDSILRSLSTIPTFNQEALALLQELAHLMLCKRYHQGQADKRVAEWSTMLKWAIDTRNGPPPAYAV